MKVTKNTENTTYYGNGNTNNAVNIVNNLDKILRIKKIALEIKCIKSNDYSIIKLKISKACVNREIDEAKVQIFLMVEQIGNDRTGLNPTI